jgi:Uma2 family endonuclease
MAKEYNSVMSTQPVPYISPEEYLAAERTATFKSEYVSGQIWAMSGASRRHNVIALNLGGELREALRGSECQAFGSDMRVFVPDNMTFAYPDLSVVCGEQQYTDAAVDTLLNPTVLIEILSPSTAQYDRTVKFIKYRRLPSLREYVLVHQETPRVERYECVGDLWVVAVEYDGLDAMMELASLGIALPMSGIYERVDFDPAEPPSHDR